jgi:hypothetical protein
MLGTLKYYSRQQKVRGINTWKRLLIMKFAFKTGTNNAFAIVHIMCFCFVFLKTYLQTTAPIH